ncbi:class I SAM-dependent methyltransferase [Candidatus Bathyarchaeota archaeon]|mgnify:CR=1 FL=1|jgi:2-polyprenyl-3-methyl-5-hydroxy-6-metoxy-1,4-benzoquinol methylase|nr:class I SAM-dependent methyltransferase [Candidatus Bathyarchaeota archaeon]
MPYYSRYDDLYKAFYAQRLRDWWYGPESESKIQLLHRLTSRIREVRPNLQGIRIIELGCGEAPWATAFAALGMKYTGVDYSPHAIARAKEQTQASGLDIHFHVMDVLDFDPDRWPDRYDIVFDQRCLQMFVIDADRRKYFSHVKQMMGPHSAFLLTDQGRDENAFDGEIQSLEQYQEVTGQDLSEPREFEGWNGKDWVTVKLPRFAVRSMSRQGYLNEIGEAGFRIQRVYDVEYGVGSHVIDLILTL